MKQIYKVVFALLVIFSVTMSATALAQKMMDRQNGNSANSEWLETTPDGIITKDTYLSVTESNYGTDISLSICSYTDGNYSSCKYGYTLTQDDVFSMDKKLDAANLESIVIDMQFACDQNSCWDTPGETATIGAHWIGNGELTKSSYTSRSKSGDIMSKYSDSSSWREATVTGSLDGSELGTTNYGSVVTFKRVSIWMLK